MRVSPRLTTILAAGALAAAVSVALVEAQPSPESTPQTEQTPPPPEAPPEAPPITVDVAPDPTPPPRPTGNAAEEAKYEDAEPRLIEPGQITPAAARTRAPYAIIEALDKVTAQSIRFVAPVGQPVRYENLIFTVRACEATTVDVPNPEAAAYMEIVSRPRQRAGYGSPPSRQVFRGWMFASSPGLNPLEHPVYDAWLIACSTTVPTTEASTGTPPAPPTPSAPPPRPKA